MTTASPVRDTEPRPTGAPSSDPAGDDQPIVIDDDGAAERAAGRTAHRGSARRPRAYVLAVIALVVVAGFLRAIGLSSGLPYTSYIDEGFVLRPAAVMADGRTWDPGWYNYPSLLIELTAAGVTGADVVADGTGVDVARTAQSPNYNDVAPTALILSGRLLVWAFATGTVLVTILLATQLAGRRAGLVAGALVAFAPALVTRSAVVIVDTPATFFVMATMLAAALLARTRRPLAVAAVGGALAGLAATSKYPSAAVILVIWAVAALTPSFSLRRKLALVATSAVAAAVTAVVTMPALVLRTADVSAGLRRQAEIYADKATETGYLQEAVNGLEVGWWIVIPALIGVVLLLRHRRSRAVTVGWLVFIAALAVAVSRSNFQPFRNVLPLVPFAAVAAATAVVALVRLVRRALPAGQRSASGAVATGLTIALTLGMVVPMYVVGVKPYLDTTARVVDSRTTTVDWLASNVRPGQSVLIGSELGIVRDDILRIPGAVTVAPTVGGADVDWGSYDYVVIGGFRDAPYAPAVDLGTKVVASFGRSRMPVNPGTWRTSAQYIEVRAPS